MIGHIKQESDATRQRTLGQRQQVNDLHALSRRGLWEILLFVLISIGTLSLKEFNLFGSVSEPVRQLLGYPPPAYLVSVALAVYCFSAMTLVLTQMANDAEPIPKWTHLGYRTVFYVFYIFSGSLANHFMAVFFVGICLYGVEQTHLLVHSNRVAHQEKELFGER